MNGTIDHREGRLNGTGSVSLFWQSWQARPELGTGGATVVIAHGLGEHSSRYARLAEHLAGQGFTVYAIDHRGHGRSEGKRAFIDRFENAVTDLDRFIGYASAQRPQAKLFLLGHSLGGALALDYALKHQHKIDGLILSGPVVAIEAASPLILFASKLLSIVAPSLGVAKIDPSAVSRDSSEVEAYATDPLNFHGKAPARTVGEVVHFVERLPPRLPALTLPLLVMHGEADTLAGVAGSRMVIASVGSTDKTLHIYPELRHEIFNELPADRQRVFDDLVDWIHRQLGTRPATRSIRVTTA